MYFIYKAPNEAAQAMTGFRIETWYHYNQTSHITQGDAVMTIAFDEEADAQIVSRSYNISGNPLRMLTLKKSGSLIYTITFSTTDSD